MPDLYDIITTSNKPPNHNDSSYIRLVPMYPEGMMVGTIDFRHDNTPTKASNIEIDAQLQTILDKSFDKETLQPKIKLDTITTIFKTFYPNNLSISKTADKIFNNLAKLIDMTYSLLIQERILEKCNNNPIAKIPSITGFTMPYYSQEFTEQYNCSGSTAAVFVYRVSQPNCNIGKLQYKSTSCVTYCIRIRRSQIFSI